MLAAGCDPLNMIQAIHCYQMTKNILHICIIFLVVVEVVGLDVVSVNVQAKQI